MTACLAMAMMAGPAQAQIGAAHRLTGAPVAAEAVNARFVWGAGGNRILFVNQADEVYYHRIQGDRVNMHIRMRGHTVGHAGDPTQYVVPWGDNSILVVTQRGQLFRHDIRAESVGPPAQIPGAPVATAGQEPLFMFKVANRLINVTRHGEVWAHAIGRTVLPPTRLGRVAIAAPRVVRHVFNVGRSVFIITDQGEVVAHDIHPDFGRARIIRSRTVEIGHATTRFAFILGHGLYAVNQQGALWRHDISALLTDRAGVRGQREAAPEAAPAPAAQ